MTRSTRGRMALAMALSCVLATPIPTLAQTEGNEIGRAHV